MKLSGVAVRPLDEALRYLEKDNPESFDELVKKLKLKIKKLEDSSKILEEVITEAEAETTEEVAPAEEIA